MDLGQRSPIYAQCHGPVTEDTCLLHNPMRRSSFLQTVLPHPSRAACRGSLAMAKGRLFGFCPATRCPPCRLQPSDCVAGVSVQGNTSRGSGPPPQRERSFIARSRLHSLLGVDELLGGEQLFLLKAAYLLSTLYSFICVLMRSTVAAFCFPSKTCVLCCFSSAA